MSDSLARISAAAASTPAYPTLPAVESITFVLPVLLQALLLHPRFDAAFFRRLRLLLVLPSVYLSARAPWFYRVEPTEGSVSINFRLAIFGPFFVARAIEYGFARSEEYAWIGFCESVDRMGKKSREGAGMVQNGKEISNGTYVNDELQRKHRERDDNWTTVLAKTLHLFTSLRGHGYAFGPRPASAAPRRSLPMPQGRFVQQALTNLLRSHLLSTCCLAILVTPHSIRCSILLSCVPFMTSSVADSISHISSYLAVGFSLFAQMSIGMTTCSLLFLAGNLVLQSLLPTGAISSFDSREWPYLFDRPFRFSSVTLSWRDHWHALFRRPFLAVGYWPIVTLFRSLGMSSVGKVVGIHVVFLLSAAMHQIALNSATSGTKAVEGSLSFSERYGGPIFFLAQATAVVLETFFARLTRRNVSGTLGRLWTFSIIIGVGLLAGRSWISLGFAHQLPTVDRWTWQRWIIPNAALLPPTIFTKDLL